MKRAFRPSLSIMELNLDKYKLHAFELLRLEQQGKGLLAKILDAGIGAEVQEVNASIASSLAFAMPV